MKKVIFIKKELSLRKKKYSYGITEKGDKRFIDRRC